jgi:hypothetical protein
MQLREWRKKSGVKRVAKILLYLNKIIFFAYFIYFKKFYHSFYDTLLLYDMVLHIK